MQSQPKSVCAGVLGVEYCDFVLIKPSYMHVCFEGLKIVIVDHVGRRVGTE